MLSKTRVFARPISFLKSQMIKTPQRTFLHIKNVEREAKKAENQKTFDQEGLIEDYSKVYKPTYTLELDRCGELLVYSCSPLAHKTVYMKYPYILFESMIPLAGFMLIMNPFELVWYWNYVNLLLMNVLWMPRAWYFYSLQHRVRKMWLLRGGKYIKVERTTVAGDTLVDWAEIRFVNPLTEDLRNYDDHENAEFLDESGQLKYELGLELEHMMIMGTTVQDLSLFFMKEGTVHHPEVFEAIARGYHVDTDDFVINTAHNERTRESHYNV